MNRENQGQQTAQFKKQRNFLVALPFVALPFVTFLLWSVGMIGTVDGKVAAIDRHGFNTSLPAANPVKDSSWNKLQFYEWADKDSAKYKSLLKRDPYYRLQGNDTASRRMGNNPHRYNYVPPTAGLQKDEDPNEEKDLSKTCRA